MIYITIIGLLAQCCFSARTIIQWIMSEKAQRVLSPTLFWVFSVAGSLLMAIYGYLRVDFPIVAGQLISYFIYLWNLKMKRVGLPWWGYAILILIPIAALAGVASNYEQLFEQFFHNADIPMWLMWFGMIGQLLFTLRFIYQWWYSRKMGESELPPVFWWISLIGAAIVFIYGVIRIDIVLMLAQGFGLAVYGRNIAIGRKNRL